MRRGTPMSSARRSSGPVSRMDERIRRALAEGRTIDIPTTGRASGQPRRIEMWFHNLDGTVYITGLPARATPITDPAARRSVPTRIVEGVGRTADLDAWLAESPLVEV